MTILDRYIARRFVTNFIILFLLMYVLVTTIDVIVQLDEFVQGMREQVGDDAPWIVRARTFLGLVIGFHGPRIFQLYAYLLGITAVGAMGFTLAQLLRHRELVAIMASGAALYRAVVPIFAAALILNAFHIVNTNFVLPRFAPLLVRSHSNMTSGSLKAFDVPFTADSNGALLQAPAFMSREGRLEQPRILVLDEQGRTRQHISAESATWSDERGAWMLENGTALDRNPSPDGAGTVTQQRHIDEFQTDLSPRVLTVRRHKMIAHMLSPRQIEELIHETVAVDAELLARVRYGRYSIVLTNLLMLSIATPFFLLRVPQPLVRRSVLCAGAALSALLGATAGQQLSIAALSPAASVFFPVIVLFPVAVAALCFVRS